MKNIYVYILIYLCLNIFSRIRNKIIAAHYIQSAGCRVHSNFIICILCCQNQMYNKHRTYMVRLPETRPLNRHTV